MKITASRTELASAARWTARAITSGITPTLLGMILTADDQGLILAATNYDATHRCRVACDVGEPGAVLVPGLAVSSFLSAIRGATVTIETEGTELVIRSGVTSSRFRTLNLDDYPNMPEASTDPGAVVNADYLADVCARYGPLSSRDQSAMPWEEGFHVASVSGGLQVSAGSRYALGRTTVPGEADTDLDALAPAKLLASAAADLTGDVTVSTDGSNLHLVTADRSATIRLYEGDYPAQVTGLLDPALRAKVKINREDLTAAVKLVATATDLVRLVFSASEVQVLTTQPKKGEARSDITDVVDCESDGQADVITAVDHITHCLAALVDPDIEIGFPTAGRQMTLRDSGNRLVLQTVRPREN